MKKIKILELFGGIGACSKALERLGINYEIVDYVEIDKYAVKSFNAIHNTNFEPQDICNWNKDIEVDLIMHGSPCQDFSLAGKQAGGDKNSGTRSSLMYETIRIVEKLKPKYVIWENVRNLLSKKHIHNFNTYLETMEKLGYKNYYQVLNAKDYEIPQKRERVFTISILGNEHFEFPSKQELKLKFEDILEDVVDEKYYLSDKQINKIRFSKFNQEAKRIQEKDYSDTILARNWKDPKCVEVKRIGGVFDTKKSTHQAGSIYDTDGISPTLDTMQGGWRQPCVVASRGRYNADGTTSQHFEVNNSGYTNTITTVQKDNYIMEGKQNDGFVERKFKHYTSQDLRIRKLTPKECWRLMGFDDEDFEKASKVNSNTQLYKQAGNSIVVNVLEAILKNLLM